MNEQDPNNSIRDDVIRAINTGKVNMKPRWHFALRAVLLLSGIILAVLALLYLMSFVIFVLHQTGEWFVPAFGMHGITEFLMSMPWLILAIVLFFVIILEILVRKYSFGYRKPLLYTSLGVLFFVLVGGVLVAQSSFHRELYDSAKEDRLPLAGSFYKQFGTPHSDNIAIGAITQVQDQGYTIEDRRDKEVYVIVTDDTSFPDGKIFKVGDSIVVFGKHDASNKNEIKAAGVRKVTGTEPPPGIQHKSVEQETNEKAGQ